MFKATTKTFAGLALLALASLKAHAAAITPVLVQASSTYPTYSANDLINDSGLTGGLHDVADQGGNTWLSNFEATPVLTFDLGGLYTITGADIWQYDNVDSATNVNRGVQTFEVLGSTDGVSFSLVDTLTLGIAAADGLPKPAQQLSFTATATHIQFNVLSNFGNVFTGLNEVKFVTEDNSVPVPSVIALLAVGLAGISFRRYLGVA